MDAPYHNSVHRCSIVVRWAVGSSPCGDGYLCGVGADGLRLADGVRLFGSGYLSCAWLVGGGVMVSAGLCV